MRRNVIFGTTVQVSGLMLFTTHGKNVKVQSLIGNRNICDIIPTLTPNTPNPGSSHQPKYRQNKLWYLGQVGGAVGHLGPASVVTLNVYLSN